MHNDLVNLLHEIFHGHDGLIREIKLDNQLNAQVTVSVRHVVLGWVNVEFDINTIAEFTVRQKINTTTVVLSAGIKLKSLNGLIYIDFSPYADELETVEDFRMSDLYFAAQEILFEIKSYTEK